MTTDMSYAAQLSRMQAICIREFDYNTWEVVHSIIVENEYDAESLMEDLEVSSDSLIIDMVFDKLNIPKKDQKYRKKMDTLLRDSCSGKIPLLLEIDPTQIHPLITTKEVSKYRTLISKLCPHLSCADQNQDLLKVMCIGAKNHHLPLLTLLFDTFSRVRVDKYADSHGANHKPVIINIEDFKIYYPYYNKLISKGRPKFVETLHLATKTFGKRLFPKLIFQPLYKIDDNIIEYVKYIIQGRKFVNSLAISLGYIPFQVDFVIIPRKVTSAVDDHESKVAPAPNLNETVSNDSMVDPDIEPLIYPQESPLEIGDIRERLQLNASNGWKFLEMKSNPTKDEQLFRHMTQMYTQKLLVDYNNDPYVIGGKNKKNGRANNNSNKSKPVVNEPNSNERRYKRVVIVVDRRDMDINSSMPIPSLVSNNGSGTKDDTMYIVLGPSELTEMDVRHLIFEQSLSYSKSMILPPNEYPEDCFTLEELLMNRSCIGCTTDCKGFLFVMSFICHSSDIIRAYWFVNGSGTRFFPQDMIRLWPGFFTDGQMRKFQHELRRPNSCLKKSIREMKLPDPVFKSWYEATTGRLINTH